MKITIFGINNYNEEEEEEEERVGFGGSAKDFNHIN